MRLPACCRGHGRRCQCVGGDGHSVVYCGEMTMAMGCVGWRDVVGMMVLGGWAVRGSAGFRMTSPPQRYSSLRMNVY
jgi:hypothetical protein